MVMVVPDRHRLHAAATGAGPVKVMISAGESSGEIHGAALIRAARQQGLDWRFFGLGGDRMAENGMRLLGHVKETAVMGLTEVLGSVGRLLAVRNRLKRALELERPAALVLIDAPDFNFALARHATRLRIPVIYYICPQVWAWREGRLRFLARHTSRRALLFKFEQEFYEKRGVSADWVGHPVLDDLPPLGSRDVLKAGLGFSPQRRLLALLPGSRRPVLERLAPVFLAAADQLLDRDGDLELVLPRADTIDQDTLRSFLDAASSRVQARLRVLTGVSRQALAAADAALVASGTSSVEATFLGTPMVVAYQVSRLSWTLGRALIKVPYATIANLVAGREVAPEFFQDQVTAENLSAALWPLLAGGFARARMVDDLAAVRAALGTPGASGRVVEIIAQELGGRGR